MATDIALTCVVLHNILRRRQGNQAAENPNDDPPEPDEQLLGVEVVRENRNPSRAAREQRDRLMDFFMNEGAVPWQEDRI